MTTRLEDIEEIIAQIKKFEQRNKNLTVEISRNSGFISMLKEIERGISRSSIVKDSKKRVSKRTKGIHTFKNMIKIVLKNYPEGATSMEILNAINNKYNLTIMRSSLSPQLSGLKVGNEITLNSGRWKLLDIFPTV
jgi:predicted RNase H-like nuclease (RuvC/YqgF family)